MELRSRFDSTTLEVIDGFYCVPSVMTKHTAWKLRAKSYLIKYKSDLPSKETVDAELDLWENLWLTGSEAGARCTLPDTIPKTFKSIYRTRYLNIYTGLRILAVLPVTTCTCERSMSTLRRVKTYLRSSMSQVL